MNKLNKLFLASQIKAAEAINSLASKMKKENGEVNVVATILLVVVAVALVVIFWKWIVGFVQDLIDKVSGKADCVGEANCSN